MKKVKIVREVNPQDFENKVNELLAEGWDINSNLSIDNEYHFYIIMTKRAAS
ncbi:DUF1737 domain-containing protein [Flavobacterium columnare]|uniref:DUF1737 domain-containing protein n=1 Tax=Flavobacterium columnare TaxID=996 RepID=UPI001784E67B|nr:DUF1737 domain-containing protein [Flavobacterium columnare]QOG89302.1 DUF1737 domain-containing protein [Flavobacterium columnare]QOG91961.1 DUF1737 domain-containing protein [Flavobacterium columnare]QOG94625.1 DUF1737 domain-containing protein [Flavobacterium columnare]QOG97284.1 DUF1737 domain-containing protein [Flavobacterium columnare]QOG99942.1 DUF1737 domain-containing protein [Flavobacterium columnare]